MKTRTLLVADDDLIFRALMRKHLEEPGFRGVELESGEGLAAEIARHRPVGCLLDIIMDEGYESIIDAVARGERPKPIAVSSNALCLDIGEDMGVDAILEKPVTPVKLAAVLVKLGLLE
ncbi:MAG: hypothetical protein C0622_03185 [Desulfuromonas sp.]|nr:MAG: hypothetical protein C0622_03185 [Desulfuromonas sp.]